jgi:hypothetical protein
MVVRIYNYLFNQCLSQNLQLTVQSVPITTKVVSSNAVHGKVYSIKHYVIKFATGGGFLRVLWFLPLIKLAAMI